MVEPVPASQAGQQAGQQAQQAANQANDRGSGEQVQTVSDTLEPVLSWERNNVEFWVEIGQLVVLLLILREVRN